MFMEALAALDPNPSKLLIWPAAAAAAGSSRPPVQVPYGVALRAMAAHIFKVGVVS
jgi:hypothetical protein